MPDTDLYSKSGSTNSLVIMIDIIGTALKFAD